MRNLCSFIFLIISLNLSSQIGYQVAVLNSATGEPRAFETVSIDVTISDSEGTSIYTGSQSALTNEFGIASLTIGNSKTFSDVDWAKLPMFISASVDGKMIGKTQILSVPVAEHAIHTGVLTKKILMSKTWVQSNLNETSKISFSENRLTITSSERDPRSYQYYIHGNFIICSNGSSGEIFGYFPDMNALVNDGYCYK